MINGLLHILVYKYIYIYMHVNFITVIKLTELGGVKTMNSYNVIIFTKCSVFLHIKVTIFMNSVKIWIDEHVSLEKMLKWDVLKAVFNLENNVNIQPSQIEGGKQTGNVT